MCIRKYIELIQVLRRWSRTFFQSRLLPFCVFRILFIFCHLKREFYYLIFATNYGFVPVSATFSGVTLDRLQRIPRYINIYLYIYIQRFFRTGTGVVPGGRHPDSVCIVGGPPEQPPTVLVIRIDDSVYNITDN